MKMSLLTKNKLGFVDSTIAEPPKNHAIFPFWNERMWKELCEHFSHANLFKISKIQEEIFFQRQGDNFVSKFYTALKTLWDELDVLNPLLFVHATLNVHVVQSRKLKSSEIRIKWLDSCED
uniref:Uncharacterized protein n=1 Tax=Cajanus cajan TaxID=3821 RepID=A0A151S0V6_CAJCA|nr:hypothetical protein KK1_029888 [Cajanus cajan]